MIYSCFEPQTAAFHGNRTRALPCLPLSRVALGAWMLAEKEELRMQKTNTPRIKLKLSLAWCRAWAFELQEKFSIELIYVAPEAAGPG